MRMMEKTALLVAVFLFAMLPLHAQPGLPAPGIPEAQPSAPAVEAPEEPVSGEEVFWDGLDSELIGWSNTLEQFGVCGEETTKLDLWSPTFTALLVVVFSITIIYLLSVLFTASALEAFARQEAYEVALTVVIAITFFSVAGLMDSVVLGTSGEDGLFDRGMDYSKIISLKLSNDIVYVAGMNTFLYMLSSTTFRLGGPLHQALRFNIGPLLKPFVDLFGVAANLLATALGTWIANIQLLCFIQRVAMPLFLPLGIFLRAFPQARGGGNALIAFAFAFYVIYPLMLSINYDIYNFKYGAYTASCTTEMVDHDGDPLTPRVEYTRCYSSPLRNILDNFFFGSGFLTTGIMAAAAILMGGGSLGFLFMMGMIFGSISLIMDLVFTVFILSIFLPLLNIFVTLTFAREIAKFLGTEINITAFTKLI